MRAIWGGPGGGRSPVPASESLLSRSSGLPAAGPPAAGAPADSLHAWLDRAMAARCSAQDVRPACRAGCPACCSQAVGVFAWEEDRLLGAFDALPAEVRSLAIEVADGQLATAEGRALSSWPPSDEARLAWRRLDMPCPLLDVGRGTCMVWRDRPSVCRLHNVVRGPQRVCDTPGAVGMAVPYVDLLAEAGRLDGASRRWLPAVLAGA